jgi:NAD(P)-dependent dehydrogenase (short-subunit alcohol dehydrogenase family)
MAGADRDGSRTFVVTGAVSGIGLATARRLLAQGDTVVGADVAVVSEASWPSRVISLGR